jgi:HEPN domain-containing protein
MENKQETTGKKFYESADAVITVSKQLTELEVAIKLEEIDREEYQSVKDFSRGAKWQARRMYSEEEVLEIIRQYALEEHLITSSKPDIWFKQYKKK